MRFSSNPSNAVRNLKWHFYDWPCTRRSAKSRPHMAHRPSVNKPVSPLSVGTYKLQQAENLETPQIALCRFLADAESALNALAVPRFPSASIRQETSCCRSLGSNWSSRVISGGLDQGRFQGQSAELHLARLQALTQFHARGSDQELEPSACDQSISKTVSE